MTCARAVIDKCWLGERFFLDSTSCTQSASFPETTVAAKMDIASPELLNERKKNKKKAKRRGPRLTGVSKQRRLANARERTRVHTLNANIDRLKDIIPLFPDEKPSKTETIRIAALYISHMTELLNTTEKTTLDFDCCAFDDLTFPTFSFDPFSDPGGNFM